MKVIIGRFFYQKKGREREESVRVCASERLKEMGWEWRQIWWGRKRA